MWSHRIKYFPLQGIESVSEVDHPKIARRFIQDETFKMSSFFSNLALYNSLIPIFFSPFLSLSLIYLSIPDYICRYFYLSLSISHLSIYLSVYRIIYKYIYIYLYIYVHISIFFSPIYLSTISGSFRDLDLPGGDAGAGLQPARVQLQVLGRSNKVL